MMRRPTRVRLLTAVTAATVLALTGCATGTARENTGGTVIGSSPTPTTVTETTDSEPPETTTVSDTTTPQPAGPTVPCGPEQVQATVTDLEPSASNRSLLLSLYNDGGTDCALTNPPILELLGPDGTSLPAVVEPGVLPEYRPGPADRIPAGFGVTVVVGWRVVPGAPDADPATDCVRAAALRVRLTAEAPPVTVPETLTACDGGTLLVEPYDINAG